MAALLSLLVAPRNASAQTAANAPSQQYHNRTADAFVLLAGGAVAFLAHESGHLVCDVVFDAHPRLTRVHFGPLPFFAVTHDADISPRRELTIDAAGFRTQEATSEWLLTRRPHLAREHAPFAKGVLAFDVLTSLGYGVVAMTRSGPAERDTRGMAAASGLDERVIGAIVIVPAALDAIRYFKPEWTWAKWMSRVAKVGTVALVIKSR